MSEYILRSGDNNNAIYVYSAASGAPVNFGATTASISTPEGHKPLISGLRGNAHPTDWIADATKALQRTGWVLFAEDWTRTPKGTYEHHNATEIY